MHSVEILWGKNHSLSQFDIDSLYRPALHSTANTGPSTVHKTAFLCIGIDKYIADKNKQNYFRCANRAKWLHLIFTSTVRLSNQLTVVSTDISRSLREEIRAENAVETTCSVS